MNSKNYILFFVEPTVAPSPSSPLEVNQRQRQLLGLLQQLEFWLPLSSLFGNRKKGNIRLRYILEMWERGDILNDR